MISLTYSKDVVRWVFFKERGVLNPTAQDLKAKDLQLKKTFESILNIILPDFIPPKGPLVNNKRVRSQVVLLSQVSPGGGTRTKVRNACRFLVNTRTL